jgi:prephenate dehydrogenase
MTASGFKTKHLTIVGLGLMGGSLALALRDRADTITAVEMNPSSRAYALKHKFVDHATDDLRAGVAEADTVILAAPVRVIIDILSKRIGTYLRSNTLVVDIGSTKHDICEAMGRLPIGVNAIGGHPMTGKEISGVEASDPCLYENRPFVLCNTRRTTPAARVRALSLVEAIRAEPIEMEPERHDRIVAGISHLPYMLSSSLVATIADEAAQDEAFWRLAAGGFRDTSRVASSDIQMMGDILSTNSRAVATLLAMFRVKLAQMEALLIAGEHEKLMQLLFSVRESRHTWVENYEQKRHRKTHDPAGAVLEGDNARSG